MTDRYLPEDWSTEEQQRRAIFMNHMYKCSGRDNGLYTGLWQEFCLKEAGYYCRNMWFEQQEAIQNFIEQTNLRQLETMDLSCPEKICDHNDSDDIDCVEPFIPTYSD